MERRIWPRLSAATASVLWSLAVAGEVVVFLLVGPWLLQRLSPATAMAIAAVAAALRWLISALTVDVTALVLIQPLHGCTFALLHLACMRLLADAVPRELAAQANLRNSRHRCRECAADPLVRVLVWGPRGQCLPDHELSLPGSLAADRLATSFDRAARLART